MSKCQSYLFLGQKFLTLKITKYIGLCVFGIRFYFLSSFTSILKREREREREREGGLLFLTVSWVGLQCVVAVFPDHTLLSRDMRFPAMWYV